MNPVNRMISDSFPILVLAGMLAATAPAAAQVPDRDYGDSPENALAYPATGQIGNFPTCLPAPFVRHGLGWARFVSAGPQPTWDPEFDGNAGTCPPPPYDLDECFADGDAGLVMPTAFTIVGNNVVPCPLVATPVSLGGSCTMARVQAMVINNMPVPGFINVLFDWDLNGTWAGAWQCPGALAPEHAVVDFLIPVGFNGLWTSPPFLIGGPNTVHHVWMRLEIAERQVGPGWNGSGDFEDGESEDYLVRIDATIPVDEGTWGWIKSVYR